MTIISFSKDISARGNQGDFGRQDYLNNEQRPVFDIDTNHIIRLNVLPANDPDKKVIKIITPNNEVLRLQGQCLDTITNEIITDERFGLVFIVDNGNYYSFIRADAIHSLYIDKNHDVHPSGPCPVVGLNAPHYVDYEYGSDKIFMDGKKQTFPYLRDDPLILKQAINSPDQYIFPFQSEFFTDWANELLITLKGSRPRTILDDYPKLEIELMGTTKRGHWILDYEKMFDRIVNSFPLIHRPRLKKMSDLHKNENIELMNEPKP